MKRNFFNNNLNSIKEKIKQANIKEKFSLHYLGSKWKEFLHSPQSIQRTCTILSLYTIIVFNIPAFNIVFKNIEKGESTAMIFAGVLILIPLLIHLYRYIQKRMGYIASSIIVAFTLIALLLNISINWNGVLIFSSVAILMFTLNYFLYYLLLWIGRVVGKVIISLTLILDAVCLYSIKTYEAYITEPTIANVFNTRYSEASSFFSMSAVMYVLILAILPCLYLFIKKTDFSSIWRFILNTLGTLVVVVGVLFANISNILWIDQNSTLLGGRLLPWSYIVNTARHISIKLESQKKAITLPDAQITTESKDVCVLIIGESARRENFSLYGYNRETNPLLAGDSVRAYVANSADVSTIGGVKAILSYKNSDELYEVLPNYLFRTGVDVVWRTSNWGEPPLYIDKYYNHNELAERFPNEDRRYDEVLLAGLADEIANCDKDKQLIVIHGYTSHGPEYYSNYPAEFEKFTPVCTSVEVASASREGLVNAYDNTILYTDYLVHSVIETLKQIKDKRCCMIFVSDHGESLGENDMFMHGTLPRKFAPKEQFEIPFIVWENDSCTKTKELETVEQFHVFHSVMKWLGIESPIYNEELNIFEPVEE